MRCPNCNSPNDEGAALCESCSEPLTAYGGQITGLVSETTLKKLEHLAVRPPVVVVMAGLDALTALYWPLPAAYSAFVRRTVVNSEGTNYMGAAFGALGATFTAVVMIPIGVALLFVAWATFSQRSWAWTANAISLAAAALLSILTLSSAPFQSLVRIVLAGAIAYFWIKSETKEWYGMH